jgi:hypothetical protein
MQQLSLFPPLVQLNHGRIQGPLPKGAPVIVSNAVGVNSLAMLVLLHGLGITPDAVVTALVGRGRFGNEHRRFHNYLPILDAWLACSRHCHRNDCTARFKCQLPATYRSFFGSLLTNNKKTANVIVNVIGNGIHNETASLIAFSFAHEPLNDAGGAGEE